MKGLPRFVVCLFVFAGAAGAATQVETLTAKALRRAHPVDAARLAETKAAFATAEARFAALAQEGLRAEVQWMPDGMVMALGTNEYRFDGTTLRMREVRPNYVAVGDATKWCFLRTGESLWICETPSRLSPVLTRVDWAGVTRVSSTSEPCGEAMCTRWRADGLVAVDPKETKTRKRRWHANAAERSFSVSLLLAPDGTPRELLQIDRLSQYRASRLTLKFARDEAVASIEWPPEDKVAR